MSARRHLLVGASAVVVAGAGIYLAVVAGSRGATTPERGATLASSPGERALPSPSPSLARRAAARDVPVLPGSAAPAAPAFAPPTITIVEDPSRVASDDEQRVVADWIARRRNEWVSACWPAPAPGRAAPEPVTVRLRAVFAPDGAVRAHAYAMDGMPDVSRCLNQQPFDPPFTGRGERVDLALSFEFP